MTRIAADGLVPLMGLTAAAIYAGASLRLRVAWHVAIVLAAALVVSFALPGSFAVATQFLAAAIFCWLILFNKEFVAAVRNGTSGQRGILAALIIVPFFAGAILLLLVARG